MTATVSPADQFRPWLEKLKLVVVPGLSMAKDFRSGPVPISSEKRPGPRRPSGGSCRKSAKC